MREVDGRRTPTRVKGWPALERRTRALLLAVARYDRSRAVTPGDRHRCARSIDTLSDLLRPQDGSQEGQTR